MKFYLAGKIPKGKELEEYVDWRQEYKNILLKSFPNLKILDPYLTEANAVATEENTLFWFGHDSWMIRETDIVIVQADRKLGVGTSQEMIIAKYFKKPVVTVLPKNTHHRRANFEMRSGMVTDWIHPFIDTVSDLIVEKLEGALNWLEEYDKDKASKKIKTIGIIDEAINCYLKEISNYK